MLVYLLFWILFRASASVICLIPAQLKFGLTKKYELLLEVALNFNESNLQGELGPPQHIGPIT
jgi:hypothetical protein